MYISGTEFQYAYHSLDQPGSVIFPAYPTWDIGPFCLASSTTRFEKIQAMQKIFLADSDVYWGKGKLYTYNFGPSQVLGEHCQLGMNQLLLLKSILKVCYYIKVTLSTRHEPVACVKKHSKKYVLISRSLTTL